MGFRAGGNFVLGMDRAIQECERVIAVLLARLCDFAFHAAGVGCVLSARTPPAIKQKLVPVRVRDCKLRGLLAAIVYIDLVWNAEKADAKRAARRR